MSLRDRDASIENEPHLRDMPHALDPAEAKAERILNAESRRPNIDDAVDHSVWDEPALSGELTGPPGDGRRLTYAEWLDWRIATTSAARTWVLTLLIVLAAGPWGVFGAIFTGGSGWGGFLHASVTAPLTEEIMKVAIALWVVEKRPYLFRNLFQIVLCAAASGLVFAAIENLIYLNVYFSESDFAPGDSGVAGGYERLARFRWTVCTALHVACSFLAGLGLARMWSRAVATRTRPKIADAAPLILAAIVAHGLYNATVSLAELSGWLKF